MFITFPDILAVDEERAGNRIRRIREPSPRLEGALATFTRGRVHGVLFRPAVGDEVLILPNGRQIPDGYARVLQAVVETPSDPLDLSDATWLRNPLIGHAEAIDYGREIARV